ncbi:MAG TPA: hypothetical protein VKV17_02815 [Bryobacteraceae bacterium]|nr:hypothetical protein [Bryobacteraceae bacterium]
MQRGTVFVLTVGLGLALYSFGAASGRIEEVTYLPNDSPAIHYADKPQDDPLAKLRKKLDSGEVKLEYSDRWGYYPALLKYFGINVDSQVLVFSKTSFQSTKISPRAPRAIYFNDEIALGYVQNGDVVEVASFDPKEGYNFYTMDVAKDDHPSFVRRDTCLQCHQGIGTLGVPGILVTSVYPSADGTPAFRGSNMITDHRSPLDQRWGGWYVTGLTGSQTHMGNAVGHNPAQPQLLDMQGTQNLTSLERKFDTSRYMAPTSDVVALMTLEHQTRMSNLMTRVGWDTRLAEAKGALDDATKAKLNGEIEEMLEYMLFTDEHLLDDPIQGVSTFTKTFPERGPKDHLGRSLRDFDLRKRMFKYPLSYMIYSPAFDAMPDYVRQRVYQRLYEILTGKDQTPAFARLTAADRSNILAIVRETKKGLPDYWMAQ